MLLKTYTCTSGDHTYTEKVPVTEHKFTVTGAVNATCKSEGYTGDKVCSDCGTSIVGTTISIKPHNYLNGVCTGCGIADPNYTPPVPEQPETPPQEPGA